MRRPQDTTTETPSRLRARAYPQAWRIAAAGLFSISRVSLPLLLLLVLLANDPPVTPLMLLRAVTILVLLPGLAAQLVARAYAAEIVIRGGDLVVRGAELQLEIPCRAIEAVAAWRVPLPGPGFSLRLRSGRTLGYGLQGADPTALLLALADGQGVESARAALRHPNLVYAHARGRRRRWYHFAGKFVVFALVPAAVLFRAHQYIAYGGPLGEYYLVGLAAYLKTFGVYWGTLMVYLVLYASVWRGLAEGAVLLAAWTAPARAAGARRAAEIAAAALYYGGVPVLLALRFLA
ncbi:MAG: hypothetical protein HY699_09090 [Deltaproteobacteria bacterium]|nr:hypothetical protein [Deltaproteobacteria bacterium]